MYADYDKLSHTQRIRAFLDAMEKLAAKYPNDDEAQIAYAITLNTSAVPTDKTYAQQTKGAAILEPISKRLPQHPGVTHYLIHLYDYPATAQKGLDAANRYAKIAPAAPHAQHMPSHIYTRVGYWKESIDSNIASVKAAKAEKSVGDQLHGQDYMVYAYLQLAQDKEARAVIDDMMQATEFQSERSPARIMRWRLRPRAMRWSAATGTARPQLQVRPSPFSYAMAITHFARALGAARSGKPDAAKADIAKLAELRDKLREAKDAYWSEQVDIQRQVATAWVLNAEGKYDEALKAMSAAADAEDKTEKSRGDAGPARAGARALRRDAARARHGQGGAGRLRGDQGQGAEPLPRLCRSRQGRRKARRPRRRQSQLREAHRAGRTAEIRPAGGQGRLPIPRQELAAASGPRYR